MNDSRHLLQLAGLAAVAALSSLLLAGCREEEGIKAYTQHRPLKPPGIEPAPQAQPEAKVRLLAAILPQGDQAWFFKLAGPIPAVAEQEVKFDEFLRSIRFPGNKKIAWQLPEGWREEPGKGMRYATLRMGPADAPLELSVSLASGSLVDNVNRWRRLDVGLPDLKKGELGKVVREVKTEAGVLQRVDMSGPGGKGGMKPPFAP